VNGNVRGALAIGDRVDTPRGPGVFLGLSDLGAGRAVNFWFATAHDPGGDDRWAMVDLDDGTGIVPFSAGVVYLRRTEESE
jgi:hypothetical protein